jgi:epoxyqueuosine reductase
MPGARSAESSLSSRHLRPRLFRNRYPEQVITAHEVKAIARDAGFELAGITPALPSPDLARYQSWVERGMAGRMGYLTDRRADVRSDPRNLLASAKSILCLGKLYNTDHPLSTESDPSEPWISRYAWGRDYHDVLREGMQRIVDRLKSLADFEYKLCVDTAPLLERSYARAAGLGWIGKNTCLINQQEGSWFFLSEILMSIELEVDIPPPDRCGTCARCIEACPTGAIVTTQDALGGYSIDSQRCISYLTIELKGSIPQALRPEIGRHVYGCDICQDVCPWNHGASITAEPAFEPAIEMKSLSDLQRLSYLSPDEIRLIYRDSPMSRARPTGLLRNLATIMGNLNREEFRKPLEHLAQSSDAIVKEHAVWSLEQFPTASGDRD